MRTHRSHRAILNSVQPLEARVLLSSDIAVGLDDVIRLDADINDLRAVASFPSVSASGGIAVPSSISSTRAEAGINLEGLGYWTVGPIFVDVLKLTTGWWGLDGQPAPLNEWGTPTTTASTGAPLIGYPIGVYTLRYKGNGSVAFDSNTRLISPITDIGNGVKEAKVELWNAPVAPDYTSRMGMWIAGSSPTDPIRDIHLYMPGYDPNNAPLFANEFLDRLKPFTTIRYMDLMSTNDAVVRSWSQRTLPQKMNQVGPTGMAYEYMVELANATHTNMWVNIPVGASEDYIHKFAQLIRDRLDPSLQVIVEYSNELWHSGFFSAAVNQAEANANPALTAAPSSYERNAQQVAFRTRQIRDIFRQEFGADAGRVRATLGAATDWNLFSTTTLAYLNATRGTGDLGVDLLSIAPYLNSSAAEADGLTLDTLFAGMQSELTNLGPYLASVKSIADSYGLPLFAYEGGQSLSGGKNSQLKSLAQDDPRMGAILEQYWSLWKQYGGGLFMQFTLASRPATWGYWGLLSGTSQVGSVKYDAMMKSFLPAGDASLDHDVDYDDFSIVSQNLSTFRPWWAQGDFNADRVTDLTDLNLLKRNIGGLTIDQAVEVGLAGLPTVAWTGATLPLRGVSDSRFSSSWTVRRGGSVLASSVDALDLPLDNVGTYEVSLSVVDTSDPTKNVSRTFVVTAQTPPVPDTGFESPRLAAGTFAYRPAGTAWTYSGAAAGIAANGSAFTSSNPPAPQGTQVLVLQKTGAAQQIVGGWKSGTYVIALKAAKRGNSGGSNDFRVLVDEKVVGTFKPETTGYTTFNTSVFSVSAGSHTVRLEGINSAGGDNTSFVDDLQIKSGSDFGSMDTGFETPRLAAGTFAYRPAGTAWTYFGAAGVAANGSAFTLSNPPAPQGNQVLVLQRTGAVEQVVSWSAGTYNLRFEAARRANNGVSNDFRVLVDGQVVGTFTPPSISYSSFMTVPFTVTAGLHTIRLEGVNSAGGDNTSLIDNFRLQTALPAAVTARDPGFENPLLAAGTFAYRPAGTAWTYSGAAAGIAANGSAFTSSNPPAPQGNQVLVLQRTGAVEQVVTGWTAGTYMIALKAAKRGNNGGSNDFRVLVDGKVVGTFKPGSTSYTTFNTVAFTVSAGSHTVRLEGINSAGGDNTSFVDDLQILQF